MLEPGPADITSPASPVTHAGPADRTGRGGSRARLIFAVVLLALAVSVPACTYLGVVSHAREWPGYLPRYVDSFAGPQDDPLASPTGVLADADRLYVVDSEKHKVYAFEFDGDLDATFGETHLSAPLRIAKNPASGRLYVADPSKHALVVFDAEGGYVGIFDPRLPEKARPDAKLAPEAGALPYPWEPTALAFAADGSLYVTDVLGEHRLLLFAPDGAFLRSVGTAPSVEPTDTPGVFRNPADVEVRDNEVWVADEGNGRVQVFDRAGTFLRSISASSSDEPAVGHQPPGVGFQAGRGIVADRSANNIGVFSTAGTPLGTFGEAGSGEGQFSGPTDVSITADDVMYVVDAGNARIQVWEWTSD